jgi:tetratricopeptide (TPR) repeat protein
MTSLRLALLIFLGSGTFSLVVAQDPLDSFKPAKPGLDFVPSAPMPTPSGPRKYPQAYITAVNEALIAFRARDWAKARAALDKADVILPPSPLTLNTRGAIFIEEKNFEKGAYYCQEALKLEPKYYTARFNLAEIQLVQGNYAEARKLFEKFVRENPKDELARFRVFLTFLLEKSYNDARRAIDQIPFPGDTPAYYYANAAWEFAHESPEEAKKWLGRAEWTFGPEKSALFADSLYEIGWMKRGEPIIPQVVPAKP